MILESRQTQRFVLLTLKQLQQSDSKICDTFAIDLKLRKQLIYHPIV
ncbi:hypothetical protein HMPREF0305_12426 [Corynebacterium pseudogenitalium ATCC 33035]|uniref:Uncharacterized protein n=1 Tax=Corynebacterium pseudogenitalium ATCC 33035 TaxID=525264 RepID=E2S7C4_9CORY|nr:hypothetical protein HMPREF0305_12426 [Corynebacterium pseudogenitalium ATCC 33035]